MSSSQRGAGAVGVIVAIVVIGLLLYWLWPTTSSAPLAEDRVQEETERTVTPSTERPVDITPISHASMVLDWNGQIMYVDPVGEATLYADVPEPDIILLTDIHGDHLSVETLSALVASSSEVVAPAAVAEQLPDAMAEQITVVANGETLVLGTFSIDAVPMYNLEEQGIEIRHEKGRGNGYVVSDGVYQVYIAGDTADIPEMRALTDIDLAFIPMNPPYTMDIDRAAAGVLAFAPAVVVPYHYRTPDGFSDVEAFAALVNAGDPDIEVELLDWYPDSE